MPHASFPKQAKGLPKPLVRRLWTKKATWIARFHPDDTRKIHVADLLSKFNHQGLDVVETRALWAALPATFDNDADGKKGQWREALRTKVCLFCHDSAPHTHYYC